ncbi:MAG TPA: STAS domain-containing protein [Ilumatobacteraceae bacterium]|jgi:anti-sigma B factor antagonist
MTELHTRRDYRTLQISTQLTGDTVLITATGEIDLDSAPKLAGALEIIDASRDVVLDMSGVHFMDSTGLSVIIRQSMRKREAGGSLLIRDPAAPVRRLLEFCCLDHFIEPRR